MPLCHPLGYQNAQHQIAAQSYRRDSQVGAISRFNNYEPSDVTQIHLEYAKVIIPLASHTGWGARIILEASDSRQWICIGGIEDTKGEICPINLDGEVMPVVGGKRRLKQKAKRMVANFQESSVGHRHDARGDGER